MTDREIFRRNFANLMNVTKVKQVDVAKYAEVSYQTVSSWVQGRAYPRADAMEKICKFFGVKQSDLTEDKSVHPLEETLLARFRSMSYKGKQKMLERAEELVKLYPKRGSSDGEA